MSRLICKKGLVLFLFPHRTQVFGYLQKSPYWRESNKYPKHVTLKYSITSMARTRMARLPRGLFELVFQSLQNSSNRSRKQIFMDFFFLFYHGIVRCAYSLESPHRSDSNEYTQHTIIVLKIEKISLNYRYLFPELVPWLTLSDSNYPCLERISMVPKMFEPLRFDCIRYNILA